MVGLKSRIWHIEGSEVRLLDWENGLMESHDESEAKPTTF